LAQLAGVGVGTHRELIGKSKLISEIVKVVNLLASAFVTSGSFVVDLARLRASFKFISAN